MTDTTKTDDWHVYILECGDHSLYTGVTNALQRRLQQHNNGKASRYTRARLPVKLRYFESCANRAEAQKREYEIKQLNRREKLALINTAPNSAMS